MWNSKTTKTSKEKVYLSYLWSKWSLLIYLSNPFLNDCFQTCEKRIDCSQIWCLRSSEEIHALFILSLRQQRSAEFIQSLHIGLGQITPTDQNWWFETQLMSPKIWGKPIELGQLTQKNQYKIVAILGMIHPKVSVQPVSSRHGFCDVGHRKISHTIRVKTSAKAPSWIKSW